MARTSSSGAKVIKVLFALQGHSLHGLSNSELAKGLKESPSTINRVLNTMIEEGAATKLETGRFALSVKVLQVAQAHSNEMTKAQGSINELNQRIHAGAHQ